MIECISADQMREVDRIAIEETGPILPQMMENAGRNLCLQAINLLKTQWNEVPIVALAGTGGNGGGGICAARHLANKRAKPVVVLSDPDNLGGAAAQQLEMYQHAGGLIASEDDLKKIEPGLILDCLVGYSLKGDLRPHVASLVKWTYKTDATTIALDIPSGIDATTGEDYGWHIEADLTMTLALPKSGLSHRHCGEIWLADLGIPAETFRRAGIDYSNPFGVRYRVRLYEP